MSEIDVQNLFVQPLHDRVLIEIVPDKPKIASGIIIPDTAKDKPRQAVVVAVGAGKMENGTLAPMTVKVGDNVLYGKFAGTDMTINGVECKLVHEGDLLAIVTEKPAAQ